MGVLLPLGPGAAAKRTPISDRFFLGGSGSLRGFHANSAGPFSERRGAPSQVLPPCFQSRTGVAHNSAHGQPPPGHDVALLCALAWRSRPRDGVDLQDGDSDVQRRHDYLGGDLYAAFSAVLNFPLPVEAIAKAGIRGHAFCDAGELVLLLHLGRGAVHLGF